MEKQGRHGTLYHFTIEYTDECDSGFGTAHWRTWAYDQEHAIDRFFEGPDEGWKPVRIARTQDAAHRMTWHSV